MARKVEPSVPGGEVERSALAGEVEPAGERELPLGVPRSLPRGAHSLARDVVLMSQRARLLEAIVHLVAADGYAATRVQDVTSYARVSRTTFYEQFADKEECFLAAYNAGAHAHLEQVGAAIARASEPLERLRTATFAYVEVLAAEPDYARTFLVEIHRAGPRALEARVAVHRRYAELLKSWYEGSAEELGLATPIPDEVFGASVAAVDAVVATRVRQGGGGRLVEIVPALLYIELALVGASAAAQRELSGAQV
jgi:AcrR family transcriptional regulator